MAVEVTDEAIEVLRHSLELASIDTTTGGARLHAARALGGGLNVQVELAAAPSRGDHMVETNGIRIFIERELIEALPNMVVDIEQPHDRIVVRPAAVP